MKREILFRGKRKGNSKWVYGYLAIDKHDSLIFPIDSIGDNGMITDVFMVDPNTVGQFMGLTDKNSNKIFEGDILQKWELDYETWEKNNYEGENPLIATKIDVATMKRFPVFWLQNESFGDEGEDLEEPKEWGIIGNIHDNPELITK